MGEQTGISWCDHTFNPWLGCQKIAPECEHCYAETWGHRFGVQWGPRGERRRTSTSNWRQPLRWDAAAKRDGVRRRVFCASLADVFEDRPELAPWREKLFWLIEVCDGLDWLLLTKRPENMVRMAPAHWARGWPSHVWAGTSAGTQRTADRAIPHLLQVPAAVRFVSSEPLLEAIRMPGLYRGTLHSCENLPLQWACPAGAGPMPEEYIRCEMGRRTISWVIAGGESGPGARPCNVEWIRSLERQCKAASVPIFVKQLGANYCDAENGIGGRDTKQPDNIPPIRRLRDSHGADMAEWPPDLRVREFPGGLCG